MISTVNSLQLIDLPNFIEDNGQLIVMEALKVVPFRIERVFLVNAYEGAIRGQHAHKQCNQFLTCPHGSVDVSCHDEDSSVSFRLDRPDIGLLVPSGIWAEQTYLTSTSVLSVLCDRPYEDEDYIRVFEDFKQFRFQYKILSNKK